MTVPVLTFFNNKGGVGKTTLVYHLSWMFIELGIRTLVVDCDPQANLTAAFIDEDRLANLWNPPPGAVAGTLYEAVRPLTRIGDFSPPQTVAVHDRQQTKPTHRGAGPFAQRRPAGDGLLSFRL